MKNTLIISVLISFSLLTKTFAAPALNLDVADQNFNSTDKIVIDQDEIRKSRALSLPSLLMTKANISIATGNMQPNSIFIRGGDSSHVLILVDGVPVYDASSSQRTINLFNFNLSKIKKIEVLKGSQSVLYGGQAMSGVIKIETFSEDEAVQKNDTVLIADTSFTRASGSKQSLSVDTIQAVNENISVSGGVYGLNARNNSPVLGSDVLYPQKTGAADLALQLRLSEFQNIFKLSYSKDDNSIVNLDNSTATAVDTNDFKAMTESTGFAWILKKIDVFTLSASANKTFRAFDQSAENTGGSPTDYKYDGRLSNVRLDINLFKNDFASLVTGMQLTTESILWKESGVTKADGDAQYEGVYLKSNYKLSEDFLFEYGVRQENSKSKALANLYHLGLIWNNLIKVEYSTGFKTPSLFQLYSQYGNKDLVPEKSKNFSLGVEHKFSDQFYTALTYFDTQFENLINLSGGKYKNVSQTRTVGVESQTNMNFYDGSLRVSLGLGYQEPKDLSRAASVGPWLLRRALQSGNIKISSDLTTDFNLGAEAIYTGEKLDVAGMGYTTVADYTVGNIFANYKVSDYQTYFARIENIENKNYETTYSYYNQGSVYKLGAQFNF